MSGPIAPSPRKLPRKQFQVAAASAFDRQAEAIQALYEKLHAQSHVIADLCIARDEAQKRWVDLAAVIDQAGWAVAQCKDLGRTRNEAVDDAKLALAEAKAACSHALVCTRALEALKVGVSSYHEAFATRLDRLEAVGSFWDRLRWLFTGR